LVAASCIYSLAQNSAKRCFYVLGRVDDVINVSGHRLSKGEMEEIIAAHPHVAECAVVGIQDELRGQVPLAFAVIKDGHTISEEQLEQELVDLIREKIGAVTCLKHAIRVARLPKTRSGKILRKTIRDIADSNFTTIPSTIEDEKVLDEITTRLSDCHIGKKFALNQ
jgi:propionyl-CoA synthetase